MTETGAARLKQAIHVARAKAGIASDVQLALRAGVSYDTLMNWYGGKTTPRGHELNKVAEAAGTSLWALQAAYDGRPPDPPPLQDAIRDLVNLSGQLLSEVQAQRKEWATERGARAELEASILESIQAVTRAANRRDGPAPAPPGAAAKP